MRWEPSGSLVNCILILWYAFVVLLINIAKNQIQEGLFLSFFLVKIKYKTPVFGVAFYLIFGKDSYQTKFLMPTF